MGSLAPDLRLLGLDLSFHLQSLPGHPPLNISFTTSLAMAETSVLTTLKELINDDVFIEKGKELARLFYSNSFLTIDLYVYLAWGTAIAAVLLLMFLLFGDESKLGGYDSPSSGYGSALSKSYETEDAIIELQQQISELQDRVIGETSGKPDAYNSFDYGASSFSS